MYDKILFRERSEHRILLFTETKKSIWLQKKTNNNRTRNLYWSLLTVIAGSEFLVLWAFLNLIILYLLFGKHKLNQSHTGRHKSFKHHPLIGGTCWWKIFNCSMRLTKQTFSISTHTYLWILWRAAQKNCPFHTFFFFLSHVCHFSVIAGIGFSNYLCVFQIIHLDVIFYLNELLKFAYNILNVFGKCFIINDFSLLFNKLLKNSFIFIQKIHSHTRNTELYFFLYLMT